MRYVPRATQLDADERLAVFVELVEDKRGMLLLRPSDRREVAVSLFQPPNRSQVIHAASGHGPQEPGRMGHGVTSGRRSAAFGRTDRQAAGGD